MVKYLLKTNETGVRVVEFYNALSLVLPLYDTEARKMYNGIFGQDIADVIPMAFQDLARASIKDPERFIKYMNFVFEGIRYVRGDRKTLPMSEENPDYFIAAREKAQKALRAWNAEIEEQKK